MCYNIHHGEKLAGVFHMNGGIILGVSDNLGKHSKILRFSKSWEPT
jgi:hypothetical protein